jgi:hypothetical protein
VETSPVNSGISSDDQIRGGTYIIYMSPFFALSHTGKLHVLVGLYNGAQLAGGNNDVRHSSADLRDLL